MTASRQSHLDQLESEAIHIIREGVAQSENPVLLFSGGKDSTVLAELAVRAFYPSRPPLPLLHVDSTWEFRDVLAFRDRFAAERGFDLLVHANEQGRADQLNPIHHGKTYTTMMRTEALRQALDKWGFDVIFGGARRDEEATRAKERIVSVRQPGHVWEPRSQRPELWNIYNCNLAQGQTARVYPLSNWTEQDLWTYIVSRKLELAPLYSARNRAVAYHDGSLIVVDDADKGRMLGFGETRTMKVRFRSLGCWPVTGAEPSEAEDLTAVAGETLMSGRSERSGRVSDSGSLEAQKRQGYF